MINNLNSLQGVMVSHVETGAPDGKVKEYLTR